MDGQQRTLSRISILDEWYERFFNFGFFHSSTPRSWFRQQTKQQIPSYRAVL